MGILSSIGSGIKSGFGTVADVATDVGSAAVDAGKAVGSAVVDTGKAVGSAAVDAGKAIGLATVGGVDIVRDTVEKLSDAEEAFGTVGESTTLATDAGAPGITRSSTITAPTATTAAREAPAKITKSVSLPGIEETTTTAKEAPEKITKEIKTSFTNPLTGEVEEFDSFEKRQKREKQVAEQAIEQADQQKLIDASNDFLTSSSQFIQDVMNPDTPDPIKVAQINEMVAKFGPENQAAMDSMLLALKQDGLAGSGAGNAMLLLMARGNKAQFSEMTQKLNTQSAQRISDMNKYGAELGLRIRSQINAEEQQTFQNNAALFNTAVASGDFSAAGNLAADLGIPNLDTSKLEAMSDLELAAITDQYFQNAGFSSELADTMTGLTGISFNATQYTSLDPARQAIISDRLAAIEKLPNEEAQRQALLQLAEEYPEAFGFPGDPEGAISMISEVDLANKDATAAAIETANNFWLTESVVDVPNIEGIIAAGDAYWKSSSDAHIDNLFNKESQFLNDVIDAEGQANIIDGMARFGVQSLSDIDTREEKEAFLSLRRFEEQRANVGTTATEIFEMFQSNFAGTELESWFDETDPEKSNVARMWIAENIIAPGDFDIDPETGQVIVDPSKISPPWSVESAQYEFYTWPRRTWGEDGELTGTSYSGEEFRTDLEEGSVFNDPAEIVEDQRLTNAYKTYKKNNDTGLNWLEWYDVTQGGTKEIEKTFTAGDNLDFATQSSSLFNEAIDSGDFSRMSDDQIFSALSLDDSALTRMINSGNIQNLSTSDVMSNDIIRLRDFLDLGLRADSESSGQKSGSGLDFSEDSGVGTGNGSVIVINGRPARIVEFLSQAQIKSANPLKTGISHRKGNLWVEYLDEPLPRERALVGGSNDFVSV